MHIPRPVDGKRARIAPAACVVGAVVGLLCAPGPALAQDAITEPAQEDDRRTNQERDRAVADRDEFARCQTRRDDADTDRGGAELHPVCRPPGPRGRTRAHRRSDAGVDAGQRDSSTRDPPNATVSVLSSDASGVSDVVLVLKDPKLSGDTLTFNVEILEGDLAGAEGPASIFIDIFGVWRRAASGRGMARRPRSIFPSVLPPALRLLPLPPCY